MRRYLPILLAVVSSSGFGPPAAQANLPPGVDGCNYFSGGRADIRQDGSDLPDCVSGGNGCYECCVTEQDQSGWFFCTEVAGNVNCSGKTTEFPDWWPDPDPTDHGQPGDNLPPGTDPTSGWTDDGGAGDLGGGGGGGTCTFDCHYAYGAPWPTYYGRSAPRHPGYHP